jgi:hypothetical protein
MKTSILTVPEIKQILTEAVINKTEKVTKITDNSVLSGVLYGVAKILQRMMKENALVEAQLFPEYAYGEDLDAIAKRQGISPRFGALGSSVYLRLVAEPGTTYVASDTRFTTGQGFVFTLGQDITLDPNGYGYDYANVSSVTVGEVSNVAANTIINVINPPEGHLYCNNDMRASGGRDGESDDSFRARITEGFNLLATDTLSRLEQVLILLNPKVLSLHKIGKDFSGLNIVQILTQNGADLSQAELDDIQRRSLNFLSISDYNTESHAGVKFHNFDKWTYIDVDFRVSLDEDIDFDEFRNTVQVQMSDYLNWLKWSRERVEWDDLYLIVKRQTGVQYLPDQFFIPRNDIDVASPYLPRLRKFVIRDIDGRVLRDKANAIVPVYYQSEADVDYLTTVLSNI